MTTDKNKEIQSISYNHLNLPVEVVKNSGDKLKLTYTATGQKLSQEITYSNGNPKKTIDYAGPHYYENKNLLFVSTAEGRVVMKSTPEYQYYLKDHLGNNRMVLTTKKETKTTRATLETAYTNTEGSNFVNYPRAVKINATIFDHTKKGPTYYSSRLSGTAREKYGLARSLSVMPGDKVWAEVFAKYLDTNQGNRTAALNNFLAAILAGTAPAGTIVDGRFTGQIQEATQVIVGKNNNSLAPKAYLNWLIFDRSYSYISGGFRQISTTAREYGQNCAHEQLSSGEINITQPGYVYFYLSNENLTLVEVYFDDFKVSHTKSPIVQTNEYYPFGMTFNSHSRENSTPQRFKFQGQENIEDLKLNWDAFQWRNYSAETGRFFNVDPMAHLRVEWTPYNAMRCNPIMNIDPNGALDKEYETKEDYKKENPNGKLDGSDGHWLKSDRESNTATWDNANNTNLQTNRFNDYQTITQRKDFYGWYAGKIDAKGFDNTWPGAAYIVAGQMSKLDTYIIARYVGDNVVKFGNEGNKAIFDDVFDDLKDLYNRPDMKGQAAANWDDAILCNEQFNVVQPIYMKQTEATISTLSKMAKGQGLYGLGVPRALRFEGDILNAQDRYNHGATKVTSYFNLQKSNWKR